jgi:prolipoprotein diacylglyceryltransferase
MLPYTRLNNIEIFGVPGGVEPWVWILWAIALIWVYVHYSKKEEDYNPKDNFKLFSFVFLGILIGGKIWYSIVTGSTLFSINGYVSFGMFLGGALGLISYLLFVKKARNLCSITREGDKIALGAGLVVFIIRIGCFLDGHMLGKVSNLPWSIYKAGASRHPVALYLALSGLLIFFVLLFFFREKKTDKNKFGKRFGAEVGLWFLLLYCFNRFWIEFLVIAHYDNDIENIYLGLNPSQWITLVIFIFIFIIIYSSYIKIKKNTCSLTSK